MPPALVALVVISIARLARLVVQDRLFLPFRNAKWVKKSKWLEYLVQCPWCVSMYFGASYSTAVWLAVVHSEWWWTDDAAWIVSMMLAGSWLAGMSVTAEVLWDERTAEARRMTKR